MSINTFSKGLNVVAFVVNTDLGEDLFDATTNTCIGSWYRNTNVTVDSEGGYIGEGNQLITIRQQ